MRSIALDNLPIVGALDRDVTGSGIVLRRLPAWTRPQVIDPFLSVVLTMPAGVRLEFAGTAQAIEIDVQLTQYQIGDQARPLPTFDLVVDGEVRASAEAATLTTVIIDPVTQGLSFVPGPPTTIRFDGLPADGHSIVEVWLPHFAVVEIRDVRVPDGATLQSVSRGRRRWAHYGSSISHCAETVHPTATWPAIAARHADVDLLNLGFAGCCLLDPFVARTIRDAKVDLISLKLGINVVNGDYMRERVFVAAVHGFLDTVRDGHPTTPILVVSPIICPVAEDHPGPTLSVDGKISVVPRSPELARGALSIGRIREVLGDIVAVRRAAGDAALHLIDGRALFGAEDLSMLPDGLHPNADGYRLMGDRFASLAFDQAGPFA